MEVGGVVFVSDEIDLVVDDVVVGVQFGELIFYCVLDCLDCLDGDVEVVEVVLYCFDLVDFDVVVELVDIGEELLIVIVEGISFLEGVVVIGEGVIYVGFVMDDDVEVVFDVYYVDGVI